MPVNFAGKRYSSHAWKKALKSNEGIFKRIIPTTRYLGPHLTDSNEFIGDALGQEAGQFETETTPFQRNAFQKLEKSDPEKAWEYLLTICNAIDKWKQDIDVLQQFLKSLKQEEKELEKEEDEVEDAEKIKLYLPDAIRRHFPDVFAKIDIDWKNLDALHQDLIIALQKIEGLEEKLENYFKDLKKRHLGFLFD